MRIPLYVSVLYTIITGINTYGAFIAVLISTLLEKIPVALLLQLEEGALN